MPLARVELYKFRTAYLVEQLIQWFAHALELLSAEFHDAIRFTYELEFDIWIALNAAPGGFIFL